MLLTGQLLTLTARRVRLLETDLGHSQFMTSTTAVASTGHSTCTAYYDRSTFETGHSESAAMVRRSGGAMLGGRPPRRPAYACSEEWFSGQPTR